MAPKYGTRERPYLEIACFDAKSLSVADKFGADRMEFCADRALGGITPPFQQFEQLRSLLDEQDFQNPVHVMIRPRGGNFIYSDAEFQQMKRDIHTVVRSTPRINFGFVFGILDANSHVDVARNSELVALAKPLPCTFHRAFDETADLDKALEDVIACGFKTILTSGGAADAVAGAEDLGRLVEAAKGRITIMPGGGVRSSNIELLKDKTKATWYHSSAIVDGEENSPEEIHRLRQSLFAKQ